MSCWISILRGRRVRRKEMQKGNKAILITLYLKIITFVLVLFFLVAFSVIPDKEIGNVLSLLTVILWGGANLAFIIVAIFAVIDCVRLYQAGQLGLLRSNTRNIKFGAIPYFVLNFLLWIFITFILIMGSRGLFIFTPIPLLLLLPVIDCFFSMLVTSIYSIGFTAGLKRFGRMSGCAAAGLIVMQLLFVLDEVAAVVLIASKRYKV